MLKATDQHEAVWKQRYRAPAVIGTQIAVAAPTHGLATSNRTGVFQLYAWDVDGGKLRQLTDEPAGRLWGVLSPDGRFVYYHQDRQGNEIGHFMRVSFEGGAPEDITPDMPPYPAFGLTSSDGGNRLIFTVANTAGFQTWGIDVAADGSLAAPRALYHTETISSGAALSHDGEIAVIASSERTGTPQFSLVALDTRHGERVHELWDGPDTSLQPGRFSPLAGDFRMFAASNRSGVTRPLIWNTQTNERIDLPIDDIAGDVTAWDWSADGQRLLLEQMHNAAQQLYVYDIADHRVARLNHPGGAFAGAYFTATNEIIAHWNDAQHPPQVIALDAGTGARLRTVLAADALLPVHPWRSVTFTSSDGQAIQGWVAVPEGTGPFPLILETHGGPTAVQTAGYAPNSQAWLDHGFAFLTVNYRGSTTFGKQFEEHIWGDLGHWEVEDMVAARDWAIAEGIAVPDQILLTGWSYGGYLTLQALGKRPGLWAGGMAGIAIADWTMSYEDSAETLRGYQVSLFGGTPAEKPDVYAKSSPITYIEAVRAPVLIIQGRNDTRTPARPIRVYEQKLRELGKPVEIHWFDAGHMGGFADAELGIDHQARMMEFAQRVLDGPSA